MEHFLWKGKPYENSPPLSIVPLREGALYKHSCKFPQKRDAQPPKTIRM